MKRGLTMVELLLALILLSAVMTGAATWMQLAARSAASSAQSCRAANTAQAAMRLVQLDLTQGDFQLAGHAESSPPRVQCELHNLKIKTRALAGGPATHEFRFDEGNGELTLIEHVPSTSHAREPRVLLRHVQAFDCRLESDVRELSVSLLVKDTQAVSLKWRLTW